MTQPTHNSSPDPNTSGNTNASRAILHVDMDAFFAAIVQRDNPELRGKPVIIGGNSARGVVSTASYEARPFGVHSAMPIVTAKRLCPQGIIVPVPGEAIREASTHIHKLFHDITPLVQPLSSDEAFLDVTGSIRLLGDPVTIAKHIKQRIKNEINLTASVGVAYNKFLAKLGSDLNKPDGMTVITLENTAATLDPLPIKRLWGVGPAAQKKLEAIGIHTFADIKARDRDALVARFGDWGDHLYRLCRGLDDRPVVPDREAKSISHEQTFSVNIDEPSELRQILLHQTEQVARRLRRYDFKAKAVTIKVRFGDFQTINRSTTLDHATDITAELWEATANLFDTWCRSSFRSVRLLGMGAERLTHHEDQQVLFGQAERDKQIKLDQTLDQITNRFGKKSVARGLPATPNSTPRPTPNKKRPKQ